LGAAGLETGLRLRRNTPRLVSHIRPILGQYYGDAVTPERIYVDHGLTGTNRARPGLREALAACRAGDTLRGSTTQSLALICGFRLRVRTR
jgi:hypothetical protein